MRMVLAALTILLSACAAEPPPPQVAAKAPPTLLLPAGYDGVVAAQGLVDPRAVIVDAAGAPLVVEGEPARLSRILPDGTPVPVAQGGGNGPWTGAAMVDGTVYVAEAGGPLGGRILRIAADGAAVPLTGDLPAGGVVGPLAAGPDGMLYLGVGTSGRAVGRGSGDIPCQNLRLQGGGTVEGAVPCTGSVLRVDPIDGRLAVHAWGFTNPAALAFAPDGTLLVADDLPPSAQATGALLWAAVPGVWYGWPDYLGQVASADPQLAVHPNPPPPPLATLGATARAATVPDAVEFGGPHQAYVAVDDEDLGGMVVFTTLDSGITTPFAANLGRPAALASGGGALWVADSADGRLWKIVAEP